MSRLWKNGGYNSRDAISLFQLTTLLATKSISRARMRITKWSTRLLFFSYNVMYRPGKQNYTADCLFRMPLPTNCDVADDELERIAAILLALIALSIIELFAEWPNRARLAKLSESRCT